MWTDKPRKTKGARRNHILLSYGAITILGFGLGRMGPEGEGKVMAADVKAQTPQQEVVKKVMKAIEQIAEDAKEKEREKDAGPEKMIEELGVGLLGSIPDDPMVEEFDLIGRPLIELPLDSMAFKSVEVFMDNVGI